MLTHDRNRSRSICLLAATVLLTSVLQVAGLNCFECENCGFNERGWETDCNRKVNPNVGIVPNACSKVYGNDWRISRKCAFVESPNRFHCERFEGGEQCFCGTDLCNAAITPPFSSLLISLPLLTTISASLLFTT